MALGDRFEKEFTIKVSSKEQGEKKDDLVAVDRDIDRVSGEKRRKVSEINQDLKDLRVRRAELLETIENGVATIKVECFERLNDRTQQVELVRTDTGKAVPEFTRPLTQEERQLSIEALDPKGTGKADAAPTKKAAKKTSSKPKASKRASAGADAE